MEDQAAAKAHHIRAWRVPVAKGSGPGEASKIVEATAGSAVDVVVLDSDMVFGLDHIKAAYTHAKDAMDSGRSASDSLVMETILYASGERQLGVAIRKMAASDKTEELFVACIGNCDFAPGAGWVPVPGGMTPSSADRLKRYGISSAELETISPGRQVELVLEKVAAVDILKK